MTVSSVNYTVEEKVMAVLEFYLSLHEADKIFSFIINDDKTVDDIIKLLKDYKISDTDSF